jgi:tyrosine-protein phosphatase SIW14
MSFSRVLGICLMSLGLPVFAAPAVSGIRNFDRLDDHVYRGAQPTAEGFQYLAKIGVKTVLDLRDDGPREQEMVTADGMKYVHIPMTGLTPPTAEETSKILALLNDASSGPVFIHCKRGADRTGAVIAAYRIDHDHWDNARALKEALSHGMRSFQVPRQNYIRKFEPRAS